MRLDWRFWLGLYVGLRILVESCRECKSEEWERRVERLLSRCETELELEEIARALRDELLSGL